MPVERVPNTDLSYYLVAFDADGRERTDDPDGVMSQRVCSDLAREPVTDVFLFSHGWKGDVSSARKDYADWLAAAAACAADLEQLRARRPGFRPAFVGLHWPSQPWGDEEFSAGDAAVSFAPEAAPALETMVERYAERIADTPTARQALRTILTAAQGPAPPALPEDVRAAYAALDREADLGSAGEGAEPGADREPFDPQRRYEDARADVAISFGLKEAAGDLLLSPLRQLSFWKMKDRARRFGESGAHALLRGLQEAREGLRLHLMGHSFGCIVVSAAVAGPPGGAGLPRPVQSLVLVQGALSLWSYCADIPGRRGRPGYFRPLMAGSRVAGPVVTTQSRFDRAVGRWYPLGAGAARQIDFGPGELPRYGGVGTFGLQGPGLDLVGLDMQGADRPYDFQAGRVYNLESSPVIRNGGGASGAHSDIAHPEVGHAVWSAALA
jgi:hypothetical protein